MSDLTEEQVKARFNLCASDAVRMPRIAEEIALKSIGVITDISDYAKQHLSERQTWREALK